MDPDDQHFFVIGAIEDANAPAFGASVVRSPVLGLIAGFIGSKLVKRWRRRIARYRTGNRRRGSRRLSFQCVRSAWRDGRKSL